MGYNTLHSLILTSPIVWILFANSCRILRWPINNLLNAFYVMFKALLISVCVFWPQAHLIYMSFLMSIRLVVPLTVDLPLAFAHFLLAITSLVQKNSPLWPNLMLKLSIVPWLQLPLNLLGYLSFFVIFTFHSIMPHYYIVTISVLSTWQLIRSSMAGQSILSWTIIMCVNKWHLVL